MGKTCLNVTGVKIARYSYRVKVVMEVANALILSKKIRSICAILRVPESGYFYG